MSEDDFETTTAETESDMQVSMKALIGMCVCAIYGRFGTHESIDWMCICAIYGCLLISFVWAK
jgi:hypothetical protein